MTTTKPNGWEEAEKLFFKIFDQDEFPTLNTNYEGYLKFKESTISIISQAILSAEENLLREIMEEMPNVAVKVPGQGEFYNGEIHGFNLCHDQVNTILESKLSTVKK